jgi:hypothetical protein
VTQAQIRIVSGGQTGVDRAALDFALELGIPCGGWCPEGRLAEDGRIADRYPLKELPGGGYRERTHQNVRDSDGSLIIYKGELEGGTAETVRFCRQIAKPYVLINAVDTPAKDAAAAIREFVRQHRIQVLNVAGPRHSKWPDAGSYVMAMLQEFAAAAW